MFFRAWTYTLAIHSIFYYYVYQQFQCKDTLVIHFLPLPQVLSVDNVLSTSVGHVFIKEWGSVWPSGRGEGLSGQIFFLILELSLIVLFLKLSLPLYNFTNPLCLHCFLFLSVCFCHSFRLLLLHWWSGIWDEVLRISDFYCLCQGKVIISSFPRCLSDNLLWTLFKYW